MSTSPTGIPQGPHQHIEARTERERFTLRLFDALWERYRERVPYVGVYERLVATLGARFVNDHIAFRTIALQQPLVGILTISRIFEALGYRAAGCYRFEDKHLSSLHFQHPHPEFPKLFISELKTYELSRECQTILRDVLATHRPTVTEDFLARLATADSTDAALLDDTVRQFHELPWSLPDKQAVLRVNAESQYAAWVLVHGYQVNHFTTLINSQGVEALSDIEKTIAALRQAGVPLKAEVEGAPGSKLRQSATEAAPSDVPVLEHGRPATLRWPYAYFELAERGEITDPETGIRSRFEGFLGPQATQLFEMTRTMR